MLAKALIPLAFGQGLDTKKDKKQQVYGMLRIAENVVFETIDSARKRNGYDSISLLTTHNNTIDTAQHLAKFKEELLLFDENTLYSFSESVQRMQAKGSVYSVFPTSWPVVNNGHNQADVDMLVVDGLKIFTYTNTTTSEIRYSVQDSATQTLLVSDEVVATGSQNSKIAAIGGDIYLFYATGANLNYKRINSNSPATLSSAINVATNFDTTYGNLQLVTANQKVIIAYCNTNGAQQLSLLSVGLNNIPSTIIDVVGENPINALDMHLTSNGRLLLSWASSTEAKYMLYSANLLGEFLAPTLLETIANVDKITGVETSLGQFQFVYAISSAQSYDFRLRKSSADNLGVVAVPEPLVRSVGLASKLFWIQNSLYFTASYSSTAQPTYYVMDIDGVVVSKISQSLAGGHLAFGTVPAAHQVSDDIVILPSTYRNKLVAENGSFFTLNGITNTEIDFVVEDRYANAALGNNLVIGGGAVQAYDGRTIAESGFNVYPEPPTLLEVTSGTPTNNATRDIANGNYGYCSVYKWTDNQGQDHRSAPSEIVSIVTTMGPSAVQVTVPTLRLTQKQNVQVEIYRTEDTGTIFYLTNSVTVPFFNDANVDTVVYVDGRADDPALITGQTLYTTGGVLENIAPPSARVLSTHTASKRIFLAGLENPYELQYSKQTFEGRPVEFNDALKLPVDPVGGPLTALASMDEKLIIFAEDATFYLNGSGPNNAGQGNTFTEPERISSDIGCLDPKSVVLTPEGLMFKSRKGIYLLGRGLNLAYIGSPVEEFNDLTITSAKVVSELNQVRFTTLDGDCLTYNYEYKFWSTFTNHKAKSAEVIGNSYYYLRTNNELYKENRQSFSDNGIPIKMRLEIGWISFTILQGYGRVYKMLLLGDWLSRHNLLVKVGYDFNESWVQQTTVTPATAGIDAEAYGLDSPYGEPAPKPYGGFGLPYQARINLKKQKCQSIKLLIEDVQATAGEGFSLSQITFQVGGKAGLFKMAKGKSFATS